MSAGLGDPSSTAMLSDQLAEATVASLAVRGLTAEIDVVTLRDHAQDIMTRLVTGFPTEELDDAISRVTRADAIIAVTPIYTTSYSGLFKAFLDVLEPDSLTGMPVLIGATGGTERHSLALDYAIRPLFAYLRTVVAPTGVYAATSDWGAGSTALAARVGRAADELAELMAGTAGTRRVDDPFALPAGFDPSGFSDARSAGTS